MSGITEGFRGEVAFPLTPVGLENVSRRKGEGSRVALGVPGREGNAHDPEAGLTHALPEGGSDCPASVRPSDFSDRRSDWVTIHELFMESVSDLGARPADASHVHGSRLRFFKKRNSYWYLWKLVEQGKHK